MEVALLWSALALAVSFVIGVAILREPIGIRQIIAFLLCGSAIAVWYW